jgi:hypothetical protein
MHRKLSIVLVVAVLASTGLAQKTWLGPTNGGDWAVATNWSGSAVPVDGDVVSLSGAVTVRLGAATAWLSDFVMTNATVMVTNWNSHLRATNVTIQSGGRILAAGPFATSDAPSRISILCTNLTVMQGGLISADAAGYKTAQGPASGGLANRSQGGGYGGRGGAGDAAFYKTNWITYGSASMPTNPGSGGCTTNWGGAGGGVIWIEASGTASVYGILTSMGGPGLYTNAGAIYGSGGSGGSIYLSCGTFTGGTSGLVRVNGGSGASGNPGRGGGGRIAVAYAQAPSPWPLVRFTAALGATGCSPSPGYLGQWGTLWFPDTAALATNLLAPVFADVQVIPGSATSLALDAWTVISNTFRLPATNFLLTVAGNMTVGTNAAVGFGNADVGGDLVLTNNGMLRIQASPTNGVAPDYGARLGVTGVLAVGSAASLQLVCDETTGGGPLVQAGRFTVANKGMIDADGAGFKNAKGPGGGAAGERTEGGGYGGAGGRGTYAGTNDGFSYGSPSGPAQCGSGGGGDVDNTQYGGFGGGLIRLETTGSVHVAGTLTANGGTIALLNTAGGSGGGIFITCGAFSGATSGIVRANGASSSGSGGRGGGGRICLNYASASWPGPRFLTSPGSAGAISTYPFVGQPGTLYLSDWSGVSEVNDGDRFLDTVLYVSNQNALTLNTLTVSNCALVFGAPDFILTVSNALVIATNGSVRANRILCDSLLLTNNASLTVTALPTNGSSVAEYGGLLAVTNGLAVNRAGWIYTVSDPTNGGSVRIAAQTARIAAGGGISAAARGYMGTRGQGGGSIGSRRAGGGYGGRGGRSDTVTSAETTGATNGSPISPLGPGSGGCYSGFGGYGGGAIRLEVDGVLTLDGTLTAAGGDASYAGSGYPGGGAGGGILALCNTLVGGSTASVLAPGGNTATSGGGGGGRICMAVGLSPENRALLLANQVPPSMTLYGAHGGFTGALSANPGTGHPHTGVNTIYLAQTGTYTFLSAGSYVLTIKGSPANYGSPVPHSYGAVIDIPADAWVTNSVTTPADESNGLRRACLGWTLTLTNGSPVDAGTGAEAVFQLTNDLHLTWRWTNEWRLIVTNGPNGAVNAGDYLPWYTNGTGITGILATAEGGYVFDRWLGEVPAGLETNNPIAVEMNRARTLEAIFAVPGGTTRTWAGNGRWQDHTNWSPAGMPGREDAAILSSGTVSVAEPFDCASLSVNGGAVLVFTNWDNRLAVAGAVTVASGAVVKVVAPYADAGPSNRLWLSCASLTIESNGLVMADGAGFTPGQGVTHAGVDASYRGGGGGHGGRGGYGSGVSAVSGAAYDSLEQPALAGGGGANLYGACGGGVIRLEVSGTATVRGTISANGAAATSNSGGGAGGAVWLSCATLAGETSGVIRANGGAGSANGGGGGGGRIAIHGQLAAAPQVRLQTARGNGYGQISYAEGQLDYISPAYGTVYVTDPGWVTPLMDGARFVDVTLFVSGTTAWAADRLVITNCSLFMGAPGFAITATNGIQIDGAAARLGVWNLSTEGDCRLTNGAQLRLFAEPTNGASPSAGGSLNVAGVLAISPGSWVLPQSDATNGGGIRCTAGSVEVATNAGVNATGKGFRYGSGPGYGRTGGYGGGGGYGGTGGSGSSGAGGPSNGWAAVPERSGSGGGAGAAGYGGGLIWVETAGEVQLDGTLVTDGSASWTSGGGGSGGGVLLACRRLLLGSSAQILARGGASGTPTAGGGGSGGRVAVWQNMTPAQRAAALADPAGVASSARLEITDAFSGFESQMNVTNGLGYTNAVVGTVRFLVGHPIAGVLILVR